MSVSISGRHAPRWDESHGFPSVRLDLDYAFIEERPYIQGIVLFDGMYRALSLACSDLHEKRAVIRQARFTREVTTLSWAEAFERRHLSAHPLKGDAVARVDMEAGETGYVAFIFCRQDAPVGQRIAHDANGRHISLMQREVDGTVTVYARRVDSFLAMVRAVGEAHRDVTRRDRLGNPDGPVRWAFFEGVQLFPACPLQNNMRFTLSTGTEVRTAAGLFDYRSASIHDLGMEYVLTSCMHIPGGND